MERRGGGRGGRGVEGRVLYKILLLLSDQALPGFVLTALKECFMCMYGCYMISHLIPETG